MTLAVHGGECAVPPDLQTFEHPRMTPEVIEAITRQALDRISIYDDGGIYQVLEQRFSEFVSAPFALSVNSGTSALLSAYYGLGIGPGDEVVVPAYTFFATATPLLALGAKPVLVDCDGLGGVDPGALKSVVTERTRAIAVTHMWGIPCDMGAILDAAGGVAVVEDASHAHGATIDGRVVGTIGSVGAWSLQGKKPVTAGEGGMLATADREVFERAVLLGHFNKRARKNVTSPHLRAFATTGTGMNLRMHPLGAAMAAVQLADLPTQLTERREVARHLTEGLKDVAGLGVPDIPKNRDAAWYAFPVFYDAAAFPGVSKERFVEAVCAEGAVDADIPGSTRPLSDYPAFPTDRPTEAFPHAYAFHERLFKLPTWYGPHRHDYAEAYLRAIEKVAGNRKSLAGAS